MARSHILVIDTDGSFRERARKTLAFAGYEVGSAACGDEGIRHFAGGSAWELVLLDHLPGTLDGVAVSRQLHSKAPEIPVLIITAHATLELQKRLLGGGVVGVLPKPLPPDELCRTVRRILASWRGHPSSPFPVVTETAGNNTSFRPLEPEVLLGLPGSPSRPTESSLTIEAPYICFRTLNGYRFWPVPIPEEDQETATRRVLRVFDVRSPLGWTGRCAVELALQVRMLVREMTGEDYPAYHSLWDTVCKSALSAYLWARTEIPESHLLVYGLDREQLRMVRAMAGPGPERAGRHQDERR